MFNIFFGIIWTLITVFCMGTAIFSGGTNAFVSIFFLLFLAIGIIFIITGVKEIIRNLKTEQNGEECFGKIIRISGTGTRVNGSEIFKAYVAVYIGSERRVELINEKIGFNPMLYKIGSYVKVKYFIGDINFICGIYDNNDIPENIKGYIEEYANINSKEIDNTEEYTNVNYNEIDDWDSDIEERSSTIPQKVSPEVQAKTNRLLGVFIIVFAIFWLAFVIMFTIMDKLPADNYYLNGVEVTQEEFEASGSLMTSIILGVFWLIGIITMILGIKLCFTKIPANEETSSINNDYDNYTNDDDDPIKKY